MPCGWTPSVKIFVLYVLRPVLNSLLRVRITQCLDDNHEHIIVARMEGLLVNRIRSPIAFKNSCQGGVSTPLSFPSTRPCRHLSSQWVAISRNQRVWSSHRPTLQLFAPASFSTAGMAPTWSEQHLTSRKTGRGDFGTI
jgi:hypothetical protein